MSQLSLFGAAVVVVRNWLCGGRCQSGQLVITDVVDYPGCVNRSVRCEACGRTGVMSTRKAAV